MRNEKFLFLSSRPFYDFLKALPGRSLHAHGFFDALLIFSIPNKKIAFALIMWIEKSMFMWTARRGEDAGRVKI